MWSVGRGAIEKSLFKIFFNFKLHNIRQEVKGSGYGQRHQPAPCHCQPFPSPLPRPKAIAIALHCIAITSSIAIPLPKASPLPLPLPSSLSSPHLKGTTKIFHLRGVNKAAGFFDLFGLQNRGSYTKGRGVNRS